MTASTVYAALGLARNPFPPTPDAGSYFFTPRLEEEFTEIRHCIETRKGFALLTGEVGLGKSTMVRRLLDTLPPGKCHSALVLNTFLQGDALLSAIQADFGLPPAESVGQGLTQLTEFLIAQHQADQISLLVIDDAQNLTVESLELVRLLCNLETGQEKLLQILLVGQPELEQSLSSPQLRQLKSRIVKHTRLTGLKKDELTRYFDFRVNAANASGRLSIHPAAVDKLYQVTQGNVRQVHLVLDRCLYGLASHRQSVIDVALIRRAVADLPDLGMGAGATGGSEHRKQRTWLAAGLLAGTATVVAAGWYWTTQQAAPLPVAPASAAPVAQAWAESPKMAPELPEKTESHSTLNGVDAPSSPRQACEQKLKAIADADDVLQVQHLPTGVADILRPSPRVCSFQIEQETWVAWLSRSQVRHILAAQQATRSVQSVLKSKGLLDIPAPDGLFGPKTGEALSRFQQQHRLAPTGQPDELTFLLLENLNVPAR